MLDTVVRAIAEPRRREILEIFGNRELSAGSIAANFNLTRPAISQHLQVLLNAGLVRMRRLGTQRLYQVRAEGTEELREFIDSFWEDRLSRLKDAAEADQRRKGKDESRRGNGNRQAGEDISES
jgi:DNA-binding transcriptional ArsR family regulator